MIAFSKEKLDKVSELIARYPEGRQKSALIPILHLAQQEFGGWLDVPVMDYVASLLKIEPIEVYEVASFYSMYNLKPVGKHIFEVCQTGPCMLNGSDSIIDYIKHPKRIFPIGRLDKPSEGLIFLTNDGDIVNKILRARNNHEKEYIVTVNKPITQDFIDKMSKGVPILDTITRECYVRQNNPYTFTIILTQGLNRQIRRMCEFLDYKVVKLKRIRIMNIVLDVPVGKWRYLNPTEMNEIHSLVATSAKTFIDDDFE